MSWDIPIAQHVSAMINDTEDTIKRGAAIGVEVAVQTSLVRTGQLRGGWQASVGGSPIFDRPPDDKVGTVTISAAEAAISSFSLGNVIEIVNFTPHGIFVNDGTRFIQPVRMTERAAEAVEDFFNNGG